MALARCRFCAHLGYVNPRRLPRFLICAECHKATRFKVSDLFCLLPLPAPYRPRKRQLEPGVVRDERRRQRDIEKRWQAYEQSGARSNDQAAKVPKPPPAEIIAGVGAALIKQAQLNEVFGLFDDDKQ